MVARRLRLLAPARAELLLAPLAMAASAVLALAGVHKYGAEGVLAPLVLVVVGLVLVRPVLAVSLAVGLTIVCEGPTFGILTFTSHLYTQVYKYISMQDLLVLLAVVSVAVDAMRNRRALRVPSPLRLPLMLLVLAMIAGVVTGHANGAGLRFAIASEHVLFYLLTLPIAVANLQLDRAQVTRLLGGLAALATVKAGLGLVEVAGHYGQTIEGANTLTYYEPTSNWLIMIALLAVIAAALSRASAPRWLLVSGIPLFACLLLSYRRSFWIASVLGLLLVVLLASSPAGRRVILQGAVAVAVAIWLIGSVSFQSQIPIVKRAASLAPSKLEANLEDRYRLDERANVLAEIRAHPISGLGVTIPWAATTRPLPVEHEEGRLYVHFAALWYWLKLGILGLAAYVAIILGGLVVAWQAWRRSREPLLRAFALASLAGIAGLVAIDTTASLTGVDARFTVLFAAQLGLLGLLARTAGAGDAQDARGLPARAARS